MVEEVDATDGVEPEMVGVGDAAAGVAVADVAATVAEDAAAAAAAAALSPCAAVIPAMTSARKVSHSCGKIQVRGTKLYSPGYSRSINFNFFAR